LKGQKEAIVLAKSIQMMKSGNSTFDVQQSIEDEEIYNLGMFRK
jgi:hypothetical protein